MADSYANTLAELELYAQEMKGEFKWVEEEQKKTRPAQKVPNREAADGVDMEFEAEKAKGKERQEKKEKTDLRGPIPKGILSKARPLIHFREYEQGVPFLPANTAEAAAAAIRELEELKASIPAYLVMYIDDDGHREVTKTSSLEKAKILAEDQMKELLDELEEEGRMQEVIIDDGSGGPLQPTPKEFVNDDESHKCEADALGLLHVFRSETHYIVYNELAGKTSRWDIFPYVGVKEYTKKAEENDEE